MKTEYNNFISEHGWFSLQLPITWNEYDDDEGTYAFFDTTKWKGNFRVTPIRFPEPVNPDSSRKYIEDEYQKNITKNAKKIKIGDYHCVTYTTVTCQENEELIIYYWLLEKNNFLFLFSFTTDKQNDGKEENDFELEKIMRVIMTIKTIS